VQETSELCHGRLHVTGMEGGADVEGDVLDVVVCKQRLGLVDVVAQAGQHQLGGGVEVGHIDAFQLVFLQEPLHGGCMAVQDRGHGAARSLAHELAPLVHQLHPGGKVEHASGEQRVVFPQAVPGHVIRWSGVLPEPVEIGQGVDHKQGGLRVAGVGELSGGIVEAQVLDRVTQDVVCWPQMKITVEPCGLGRRGARWSEAGATGPVSLALVAFEALMSFEATTLSSFDLLFSVSSGREHGLRMAIRIQTHSDAGERCDVSPPSSRRYPRGGF